MMTIYAFGLLLLAVLVSTIAFPGTMGRRPGGQPWLTKAALERFVGNPITSNAVYVCVDMALSSVVAGTIYERPHLWWLVVLLPILRVALGGLIGLALGRVVRAQEPTP